LEEAKRPFKLIVVNDGSSDQTSSFLSSLTPPMPLQELRHASNRGYGAALRTAFLWILSDAGREDAVVTLDADNTHDPIYIQKLITKLEEGFDVATASYTMAGGRVSGIPLKRRVMSRILNRLLSVAHPLPGVDTYTNGYRAYRLSIMRRVHDNYGEHLLDESGFPGGTEFFLKCANDGGKLAEVPFDLHYENRGSASKIWIVQTVARYLRLLGMAYRLR
jgi:dolichol-phosphate mannosyltransferase